MSTEQGGVRPEAIKIADRLQDYLAAKDPQDVPKLLTDVYALKELGEDKHPLVGKMLFQIGREMEVPVSLGINAACGQIINTPGASRKEMVRGLRRNVQALRMLGLDNSELEHGQETQELINGLVGLFPEIDNPLFGRSNLWRKVGEGVKNIPSAIRSVKREIRKPAAPAASRAPETRQPRIISREQFRQRLNNTELTVKGFEAGYSEVESITDEEDPTGDLRAGGLMLLRQRLDHCESKDVFRTVNTLHRKTFSEVTSKMPVPLAREFEGRHAAYWDIKRAKGEPLSEQFGYLRSLVSDASESYKSDYRSAMQEYVDSPEYTVNPDRYYAGRLVVLRERYAEVAALYITQIAEKDPDALQSWVAGEAFTPGFIDNLGVETEKGKQVALEIYKSTFYILDRAPEGSTGYNNALEWQKALEARLPALAEYGNAIRFTALLTELREAGHLDNIYKSVNGFLERIEQIPDDSTGLKKVQAWAALNQVPRAYDDIDGKRKIFHDFNSIERNIDKLIYHLKLDADTVMGAFGAYQIIEERIRRSGDGTEETQDKLLKDALFVASRGVTLGGIKLNRKEARAFVEAINGYRALNGADEMAALPALPLVDKVKGAVAGILGKAGR